LSIAKLQFQITQIVILAVFSFAGFEMAAALTSWRNGALVPKYLVIAVVLLVAGAILLEVYRRVRTAHEKVVGVQQ
jgi:hypothetical protein